MSLARVGIEIDERWTDGIRHVVITRLSRPAPWTVAPRRTNQRTRRYRHWLEETAISVKLAMAEAHILEGFLADDVLGAAFGFGATLAKPPEGKRRQSVLHWDLRNLQKALEDAMSGILYPDDRQIRLSGPSLAVDTGCDWWSIHVWRAGSMVDLKAGERMVEWSDSWQEFSVPYRVRMEG